MKFFVLLALSVLTSVSAFAQQTCYVDMVDRYNRPVATYTAWDRPSVCAEAMKQCRKAIRFDPQLGGVDCIREAGSSRPSPSGPSILPRPQPIPHSPPPSYGSVEIPLLIQDLARTVYDSQKKTKLIEKLIYQTGSSLLSPLVSICSPTNTWHENSQCLLSGIQRAPVEFTSEHQAIQAVGIACQSTNTWAEEKSCFVASLQGSRLQSIDFYAQSCVQIYQSESSARCFRQVFGAQNL